VYASGSGQTLGSGVLLGVLPSVEDAVLDELTRRVKLVRDSASSRLLR
jgi:hypothetical protein